MRLVSDGCVCLSAWTPLSFCCLLDPRPRVVGNASQSVTSVILLASSVSPLINLVRSGVQLISTAYILAYHGISCADRYSVS